MSPEPKTVKLKTVVSLTGAFCGGVLLTLVLMLAFGFRTSHWTPEQVEAARVKAIMELCESDPTHPIVTAHFLERSRRPILTLSELKALNPHPETRMTLEDMERAHGSSK